MKDLDFTSNLLLLDWLQSLDDTLFIVDNIDALKDLRVFTTAYFANDFIVFLVSIKKNVELNLLIVYTFVYIFLPPLDLKIVIVPIRGGHLGIYISIAPGYAFAVTRVRS